jgi:hypothetical protein
MLTATNKRLLISESRDESNWCTLYRGKPDQHDTYASHASPHTPSVRFMRAVHVCGNLSRWTKRVGQIQCSKKKCSRLHLSAQLSSPWDSPQFLSQPSHWSSAIKPNICWRHGTLVYWAHKYQHAISTFNTCSRGPTHRSLTNTGGGYNLWGTGLPHTTLWPSQSIVSTHT